MNLFFRISIFLTGLCLMLNSCSSSGPETTEEKIIGKWTALWTTDPAGYPAELGQTKKFTMNGEITFNKSGKITINAFGYEDCIFSSDTMSHTLNWTVSGDTMNFFSGEDPYGIPYRIQKLEEKNVELLLMEDIKLSLTKN